MIRNLKLKDKLNFCAYCQQHGKSIFADNSALNLAKEFRLILKYNKYCIIDEEKDIIRGLLFIDKKDKEFYIRAIYQNSQILDRLLIILTGNTNRDLIFRLNDYRVVGIIKKHFFRFKEKIGNDYVYIRKYFKKTKKPNPVVIEEK